VLWNMGEEGDNLLAAPIRVRFDFFSSPHTFSQRFVGDYLWFGLN
jgi:hypothetical protein